MKTKTAAELMSKVLVTTTAEAKITEAIDLMLHYNVSCLPVIDAENNLLGIITEYDLMNFALSGEADRTLVGEAMARNVISIALTDNLETIVNTCTTRRLHRAPVVEKGKLVGIISRRDLLREMLAIYKQQ
jgi:CBS domain-containing protein